MEVDYEENYHLAREEVAKELIKKYGFVESYRDIYRLTLDSTNYSFHLIFEAPEGRRLNVTEKGSLPKYNCSYLGYVFDYVNDDLEEVKKVLASNSISLNNVKEEDYDTPEIIKLSFMNELAFLESKYNYLFD